MRLYHGSPVKGLKVLRPSDNRSFPVIYFSDEPTVAATYVRGRTGQVYTADVTLQRPMVVDAKGRDWENAGGRNVSTDALAARAYARGHDGIIIHNVVDEVDEEGYPVPDAPPNNIYAVFAPVSVRAVRRNPPIGPRPAHRIFTESPAFKAWFGRSVLVRADGDPLVLFHGTDKDFTVFEKVGTSSLRPLGFWFADDPDEVEAFGDRLMPVYLRVEKPYYADLRQLQEAAFEDKSWARRFRDELIRKGHDGIIIRPKTEQVGRFTLRDPMLVCVFDPRQIKSAIGNIGTFDKSTPDITRNPSGRGGTGRRARLKIEFPYRSASSSLAAPTIRRNGTKAQARALLDEGICGGARDDNFYHVTTESRLDAIARHGLESPLARLRREEPDIVPGSMADRAALAQRVRFERMADYSAGKVFLSHGIPSARVWADYIRDMVDEDEQVVVLRIRPEAKLHGKVYLDEKGTEDAGCSFYVTSTIKPQHLEVVMEGRVNPRDLRGRAIPERYLAGLPRKLKDVRIRELTVSRDAYRLGDFSELPTDRLARSLGLVKKSAYSKVAEERGIEWRGDAKDMAKRVCAHYGVSCTRAVAQAITQAYAKGLAAWKSGGHRPGATARNWAVARVNSLVVGGKTAFSADGTLFRSFPASLRKAILAKTADVVAALRKQGRDADASFVRARGK